MSIYLDKFAHVQVIINCQYSVAQMWTRKDMLTHYLGVSYLHDVMIYNELTTSIAPSRVLIGVWDLSWRWCQNPVFTF